MSNGVTMAGMTLQAKNPAGIAQFFKSLDIPIVEHDARRFTLEVGPAPVNVIPPFQDLATIYPLGGGITIDLYAEDLDGLFQRAKERQCVIVRGPGTEADGRYGFIFQIPDSGGYCVRVLRMP